MSILELQEKLYHLQNCEYVGESSETIGQFIGIVPLHVNHAVLFIIQNTRMPRNYPTSVGLVG